MVPSQKTLAIEEDTLVYMFTKFQVCGTKLTHLDFRDSVS